MFMRGPKSGRPIVQERRKRQTNGVEKKIVLLTLAVIVLAGKWPVLSTPYHWDETLWVGFAYRLSRAPLWTVLPGFHPPTEFGGRPPGLFLPVAALFKLFGPSIRLSHFFIACFSLAGAYSTYLLGRHLYGPVAGVLAALFLLFDSLYFAQSAMFLADLPAAALGVTSVYLALRGRHLPYLLCSLYLLLLKETALAIVFALAAYGLVSQWSEGWRAALRRAAAYALPLAVMAAYYCWQKAASGKFFVNYAGGFDPFQLSIVSALNQLPFLTWSLFVMQGRWMFSLLIAAGFLRCATGRPLRAKKEWLLFLFLLMASGYSFAFLYFLPRYVLPWAPFFYLLAAWSLAELIRHERAALLAGSLLVAVSVLALFRPRLVGNGEWNMSYLAVVRAQQEICALVEREYGGVRVLTVWPLTAALSQPDLGYVKAPVEIATFSPGDQLDRPRRRAGLVLVGRPAAGNVQALERLVAEKGLHALARAGRGGAHYELYRGE
jgi:hypothetical protein